MTRIGNTTVNVADDMPRVVADYLRQHPEFFIQHGDLLADLNIPHPSGKAVSLVERQLAALRTRNTRVKKSLAELVRQAQANEGLHGRIHELTLELIAASAPQPLFDVLRERLRSGFRADEVAIQIFADAPGFDHVRGAEFAGRHAAKRGPFAQMLTAAKPLCGRLAKLQSAALFATDDMIGSAVVLPLRGKNWDGLLGIRSNDPVRFDPDLGTEMLTYLADVTALILDSWIGSTRKR